MPCKVIEQSKELEEKIYNLYLQAIKMISFDYQIMIITEKTQSETIDNILEKNIYLTLNNKQKNLINKYKEYLYSISKKYEIFKRKFYIIVKDINNKKEREINEMSRILKGLEIEIKQIKDDEKIFKLLYETINEINGDIKDEDREHISE